jgi:hypothetical protein
LGGGGQWGFLRGGFFLGIVFLIELELVVIGLIFLGCGRSLTGLSVFVFERPTAAAHIQDRLPVMTMWAVGVGDPVRLMI